MQDACSKFMAAQMPGTAKATEALVVATKEVFGTVLTDQADTSETRQRFGTAMRGFVCALDLEYRNRTGRTRDTSVSDALDKLAKGLAAVASQISGICGPGSYLEHSYASIHKLGFGARLIEENRNFGYSGSVVGGVFLDYEEHGKQIMEKAATSLRAMADTISQPVWGIKKRDPEISPEEQRAADPRFG